MDWATKKFNYKIVNENGRTIAHVYKKLGELESFINESKLQVNSIERTGPDDFIVRVFTEKDWQI